MRKRNFRCHFLLVFGALLLFGLQVAISQETRASLGGKVTDRDQGIIQKAQVTVTSLGTGVTNKTETNSAGEWRVQYLVPGHYQFKLSAPGFKAVIRTVELQVGDQKTIDEQLEVGSATEVVKVESTTPLIDTTAAVSGTVITTEEIEELPSQSNAPTMLVGLTPGATVSGGVSGGIYLWSNQGLSGTTVNAAGSGAAALNYTIDGGTDTNQGGQVAFEPPADAVSEFRVDTNAYDAAIGRESSATVGLSIKSGTRNFHGDLYEMNQNNFLNAKYAQNKVAPIHTNEWGATIGGPVWFPRLYNGRNKKTFFFFSYDGIHNTAPANTGYMSLPTMLERQGDFSQSFTTQTVNGVTTRYPIQLYDPATVNTKTGVRTQFPGNVIPSGRISPIAKAIFAMMPKPDSAGDGANTDSNNYVKREIQQDTFTSLLGRFDQSWNNANHSYVNLRYNKFDELSMDPFGPSNVLNGIYQHRNNKGITIDHTLVLSSSLLLDVRYNVTRYEGLSNSSSAGYDPTKLGFNAGFAALQQYPSMPLINGTVTGAEGGLGTSQAGSYSNDTDQTFTAALTKTHLNHTMRFGGEYLIQQEGTGSLAASGGQFSFDTKWTVQNPLVSNNGVGVGNADASFLLGLPSSGYLPTTATGFGLSTIGAFTSRMTGERRASLR